MSDYGFMALFDCVRIMLEVAPQIRTCGQAKALLMDTHLETGRRHEAPRRNYSAALKAKVGLNSAVLFNEA